MKNDNKTKNELTEKYAYLSEFCKLNFKKIKKEKERSCQVNK